MSYEETVALLHDVSTLTHHEIWEQLRPCFTLADYNQLKTIYSPDPNWVRAKRFLLDEAHDRGTEKGRAKVRAREEQEETA
jgi:hypothetical protein